MTSRPRGFPHKAGTSDFQPSQAVFAGMYMADDTAGCTGLVKLDNASAVQGASRSESNLIVVLAFECVLCMVCVMYDLVCIVMQALPSSRALRFSLCRRAVVPF